MSFGKMKTLRPSFSKKKPDAANIARGLHGANCGVVSHVMPTELVVVSARLLLETGGGVNKIPMSGMGRGGENGGKVGAAGKVPVSGKDGKVGAAGKLGKVPVSGKEGKVGDGGKVPVSGKEGKVGVGGNVPVSGKVGVAGKVPVSGKVTDPTKSSSKKRTVIQPMILAIPENVIFLVAITNFFSSQVCSYSVIPHTPPMLRNYFGSTFSSEYCTLGKVRLSDSPRLSDSEPSDNFFDTLF